MLLLVILILVLTFKFGYSQTVAMKFIPKHGKSDKDIHNLRQEIEVFSVLLPFLGVRICEYSCSRMQLGLYNVV